MNDYVFGLLQRYRSRGVLVDTNILLLFFVGSLDRTRIAQVKRTIQFSAEDYDLLLDVLSQFDRMVTTPNMLSEVNSFLGLVGEPARTKYFRHFAKGIGLLAEEYVVSAEAAKLDHFPKLGLTDVGIMHLVKGNYLVLTDDFELYGFLGKSGIDVLNFNHLRPIL
jgi:hypothetical protein